MAPTVLPIDSCATTSSRGQVLCLDGERRHFVVQADGEYGALSLRAGDVLVTGGRVRPGDVTVLLARGMGRPRLGTVTSNGLLGPYGEPCSTHRWMAAGRVLEVIREPAAPVAQGNQLALNWSLPHAA